MQASSSAPEAQTLQQLSQAKKSEAVEARRMKRDLQTLHSDPSTLPKPSAAPTPANAVASPQVAVQPARQELAGEVPPGADTQQAAAAAQLQVYSDQAAAASAARGSSPAAGTAAAPKLADGVTTTAQAAAEDTTEVPDLAVPEEGATATDEDRTPARAGDDRPITAPEAMQLSEAKQDAGMGTGQMGTSAAEPQAEIVRPESAKGQEADTADPAQPRADGQKAKKQGKAAATDKPKGKQKAPLTQKGGAKRQKLKQDDRSYSEEAEAAVAPATQKARAHHAAADDDDDEEAAISSDEEAIPAALQSLTKTQRSKRAATVAAPKGKSAAGKKGARKVSATTAHVKKSAAGIVEKAHAKAFSKKAAVKRKNSTDTSAAAAAAAADGDDDDHNDLEDKDSMLRNDIDVKAQTTTEAEHEAADEVADDAPPAAATRERRAKPQESYKSSAKHSPQKTKKPAKQQKLPFNKVAAGSPKQSKASAAVAAVSAVSDGTAETAAAPVARASKAKAGSDRKSAASAEPVSGGKEAKGKQPKASPQTQALQTQAKRHAKTGKQQKQKAAVGEHKCIWCTCTLLQCNHTWCCVNGTLAMSALLVIYHNGESIDCCIAKLASFTARQSCSWQWQAIRHNMPSAKLRCAKIPPTMQVCLFA